MEGLTSDNILQPDEIDALFVDDDTQETPPEDNKDKGEKDKDKKEETTEVDIDDLFQPESVGSEEDNQETGEDTDKDKGSGTSPSFYSSIANALKNEGIFPDLDDEEINSIKEADDFRDFWNKQIKAELDDR